MSSPLPQYRQNIKDTEGAGDGFRTHGPLLGKEAASRMKRSTDTVAFKPLRVLVACEESGTVRNAFNARGHDAWSCDLLPRAGKHICDDVLLHLEDGWDLMIAHPPCTYLAVSGLHWNKRVPGREKLTHEAMIFVLNLMGEGFIHNPIPRIALENPISCISTRYRKPDQIIQPWQFGHPESKATCLWLKGLPPLKPTNVLPLPLSGRWENQTPSGQNKLGPSPERAMLRSKTYQGMADAMADQWGSGVSFLKQERLALA